MTSPGSPSRLGRYAVGRGWLLNDVRTNATTTGSTSVVFSATYPPGGVVAYRRPGLILGTNAALYVYDGVNSQHGTYTLRREGIRFDVETTTWVESSSDLSAAFRDLTKSTARVLPPVDESVLVLRTSAFSFSFAVGDPLAGARAEAGRTAWAARDTATRNESAGGVHRGRSGHGRAG